MSRFLSLSGPMGSRGACTGTTHDRLHGYLADVPPAEFDETFYGTNRTDQPLVEIR